MRASLILFLSTLSLRRATHKENGKIPQHVYFYPRSPCGERHLGLNLSECAAIISIHALLAESDFLRPERFCDLAISIHALLAESDDASTTAASILAYFYPRSPCGERQWPCKSRTLQMEFLSTLSLRRATLCMQDAIRNAQISIHALLAESDGTT